MFKLPPSNRFQYSKKHTIKISDKFINFNPCRKSSKVLIIKKMFQIVNFVIKLIITLKIMILQKHCKDSNYTLLLLQQLYTDTFF